MTQQQANNWRRPGTPWIISLTTIALVASGIAWARWERPRDLVEGLPRPAYSRLVEQGRTPRGLCTFSLLVASEPAAAATAYRQRLEDAGWRFVDGNETRSNYLRDGTELRVAHRTETVDEPGWSRVRVAVAGCLEPS